MDIDDDEALQEFVQECHEGLDELERDLVDPAMAQSSPELVDRAFRVLHTIKGSSGFLAFRRLEALTHRAEDLLARVRAGDLAVSPAVVSALLSTVECVRALLKTIESTGSDADPTVDPAPVVAALDAALRGPRPAPTRSWDGVERRRRDLPVGHDRRRAQATVRVPVEALTALADLCAEVGDVRTRLAHLADGTSGELDVTQISRHLDDVCTRLRDTVHDVRVGPAHTVWSHLPQIVQGLGAHLGRPVRLETGGDDTPVDRVVLDSIRDPLGHLVRNALSHGIEDPAERVAAGKAAEGSLRVTALVSGGELHIEVTDDGRGMDACRIGRVAVRTGLVAAAELAAMTETEILELIFRPGFSTATGVTKVSGRGVGMDVVRTNVEQMGGRIELASRPGLGTTVRMRVPTTSATA